MEFRKATDVLFAPVGHADLARALGVSVATIRQARLKATAIAHRTPPANWQDKVIRLVEERIKHYQKLIDKLHGDSHNEKQRN